MGPQIRRGKSPRDPVRMPFSLFPSSKTARDGGSLNPMSCPSSPWVWRFRVGTLGMGLQEWSDREVAVA